MTSYKRRGQAKRKAKKKWSLPGHRYSLAYTLVAGGEFTEEQIAAILGVELDALKKAMSQRYFQQQVARIRNAEAVLKAAGLLRARSSKLASQALKALRAVERA